MTSHFFIHPEATIHPTVEIGFGCWIGPKVVIERNVKLGPYCVIGSEPEHRDFFNKKSDFGILIKEGARLSEFVTVHCGTVRTTVVGPNTSIFQKSHIGHDAWVDASVIIGGNVSLAGHTQVMIGANISGHSCTVPFATIGAYSFIGAGSLLNKHVPPGERWIGYPARKQDINTIGLERAGIDLSRCIDLYLETYHKLIQGREL